MKKVVTLVLSLLVFTVAQADQEHHNHPHKLMACQADFNSYCQDAIHHPDKMKHCIKDNANGFSRQCQHALFGKESCPVLDACMPDFQKYCSEAIGDKDAMMNCIALHINQFTQTCKNVLNHTPHL